MNSLSGSALYCESKLDRIQPKPSVSGSAAESSGVDTKGVPALWQDANFIQGAVMLKNCTQLHYCLPICCCLTSLCSKAVFVSEIGPDQFEQQFSNAIPTVTYFRRNHDTKTVWRSERQGD